MFSCSSSERLQWILGSGATKSAVALKESRSLKLPGVVLQVVDGLKTLLNPSGSATPSYISTFDSYNTALAFVQALGHTQDSNGDTNQVRRSLQP
jgi:hypothetical protein